MKVELMPVDQVIPYARNPRINAHAIEKVAASIKEFGFRQPIVTDKELVIVVGHVRFLAHRGNDGRHHCRFAGCDWWAL